MNSLTFSMECLLWAYSFANIEQLILSIVLSLIIIAILFYIIMLIRDSAKQETYSKGSNKNLINFEKIYENGELTKAEYQQIKRLLAEQYLEELQEKEKQKELKKSVGIKMQDSDTVLKKLLAGAEKRD